MRAELVLYFYGAVCASMILFNLIYSLVLRRSLPRLARREARLQQQVQTHLTHLAAQGKLTRQDLVQLGRALRRVRNLIAFDRLLPRFFQDRQEELTVYLQQLTPVILYLAARYKKRETMQAACFAHFLAHCWPAHQQAVDSLQQQMLEYMALDNLYCRLNALKALCRFGSPDRLLQALQIQDDGKILTHDKLLTENLLAYQGDHHQLIAGLWQRLDRFSPHTQLAVLNYIRFQAGQWPEQMLAVMTQPRWPKESRLAAIRYFGRCEYLPALEHLLAFVRDLDPDRWEYATVAAASLARYRQPRVVKALKQALHSSSWYIRAAAARSLEEQQVDYQQLLDILSGSDRYAREMITYHLEARRLRERKEAVL